MSHAPTSPDTERPRHVSLLEEQTGEPLLPPPPQGSLGLRDKGQKGVSGHQMDTGTYISRLLHPCPFISVDRFSQSQAILLPSGRGPHPPSIKWVQRTQVLEQRLGSSASSTFAVSALIALNLCESEDVLRHRASPRRGSVCMPAHPQRML